MEKVTVHIIINDKTIDEGDLFAVIDPIWWTVNTNSGVDAYNHSLMAFSLEQRYLCAIAWYMTEVNNGGHDQFFFNDTGIVWQDTLAGFKAIGIDEATSILSEAITRMGGNPTLDWFTRQEQLMQLKPDFEDLDHRFYKLQGSVEFSRAMAIYMQNHRKQLYFDGNVKKFQLPNQK